MKEVKIDVPVQPPQDIFLSKEFIEEAYRRGEFIIVVGPQHPGSGHMRLIVKVKGDIITEVIPDVGYVHRGIEKLAENKLFIQNIPLVERPSIMDCANMSIGYVRAIEKGMNIEVPARAKYIRTILAELCRIGTHLYDAGILAVFIGHTTGFMWTFGLREYICEALCRISGARVTASFIVPGGLRRDVDEKTLKFVERITYILEEKLKKFERIFIKNPAVIMRLKEVGILTKEEAIKFGVVGPFLRASGVEYDVRKVEPYDAYGELDFDIPVADDGDSYSRFLVRVYEIRESINIIREAIKNIPNGPIISEYLIGKLKEKEKIKKDIKGYLWRIFGRLSLPAGEYTTLTEAARGTLLYTLISDGKSTVPYRLRIVTPGWAYLRGFMEACKGERLADLQAIYGSFGYFPPEADR